MQVDAGQNWQDRGRLRNETVTYFSGLWLAAELMGAFSPSRSLQRVSGGVCAGGSARARAEIPSALQGPYRVGVNRTFCLSSWQEGGMKDDVEFIRLKITKPLSPRPTFPYRKSKKISRGDVTLLLYLKKENFF